MPSDFEGFRKLVSRLRGEDGCPWDRKQTLKTLAPYIIEEAREVADAVEAGADEDICEELGDVLLVVCMMAQVASEEGRFGLDDCVAAISEKVVRRHPHVFGDVKADSESQVVDNWHKIKEQEKRDRKKNDS